MRDPKVNSHLADLDEARAAIQETTALDNN